MESPNHRHEPLLVGWQGDPRRNGHRPAMKTGKGRRQQQWRETREGGQQQQQQQQRAGR